MKQQLLLLDTVILIPPIPYIIHNNNHKLLFHNKYLSIYTNVLTHNNITLPTLYKDNLTLDNSLKPHLKFLYTNFEYLNTKARKNLKLRNEIIVL